MSKDGRADKGGEIGVNGEHYKGGQFLPSHEGIEKGRYKFSVQQRDPLTPEQLAKIAQEEAEVAERKAKNALIAQEPQNAFLIAWLETRSYVTYNAFGTSGWYDTEYLNDREARAFWRVPENIAAGLASSELQQVRNFTSEFLGSMYNELALWGKRPAELSDKQFDILAEIWIKEQGARKGSKRWEVLWNEFCDKTLPEDF